MILVNPFKYKDCMLPIASLNSFILNGQKANDLFRPELMHRDLVMLADTYQLNIEKNDLKTLMDQLFYHEHHDVREDVKRIGIMYGQRLAMFIDALKHPTQTIKAENLRWKEEHWAYWKDIKQLYVMGGLASSPFHEMFEQEIKHKVTDLDVHVQVDSQDKALYGMLERYQSGHFLLFDFGQSFIKRAYVIRKMGENIVERKLSSVQAKHLEAPQEQEMISHARQLHRFILDLLITTLQEVSDVGCDILISIANYVRQGELNPGKSSYGVLSVLSTNYETFLEEELMTKLQTRIHVKLEHDATAMAHHVPQEPFTAVITLGTAFGISFID